MTTKRADSLNPHEIIVIGGRKVKVMGVSRFGSPVTHVVITHRDVDKPRGPKSTFSAPAETKFEFVGDARLIGKAASN